MHNNNNKDFSSGTTRGATIQQENSKGQLILKTKTILLLM